MFNSLFISKNDAELTELRAFTDSNGIILVNHSFLTFTPISFELTEPYDVLFFGSPRAVMFFKAKRDFSKNSTVACVGSKTKKLLESLGYQVAFSGEEQRSISEVAEDFKDWLGDRKVLFPISTRSLGTISKNIPPRQKILVECYETNIIGKEVPPCDCYVFTSPSNVEGFFQKNKLPVESKVIAWGESTAGSLDANNVSKYRVLSSPTIGELVSEISD